MRQLRDIWQRGDCVLNGWLSLPCAFSAELMAKQPWESLTIDMQHGLIDYTALIAMLPAVATKPVMVRVSWLAEADIMKALDAGAAGIICPMINTAADAKRFADCMRYPPAGKRSFGPIRAQAHYGADYYARANKEIVALAMIETKEALANVDEILSVDGIDGVYIGPADLSCSLGCQPSFAPQDACVLAAIESILSTAKQHKAIVGIHTNDAQTAIARKQQGFNFITAATDARLLSAGANAVIQQFKQKESNHENQTTNHGTGIDKTPNGTTY